MTGQMSTLLSLWKMILILVQNTLNLCSTLLDGHLDQMPTPSGGTRVLRRQRALKRLGSRRRRIHSYRGSLSRQWQVLAEFGRPSRAWVAERSSHWWDRVVCCAWSDEEWLQSFRMTRATFYEIVDVITPRLQRKTTRLRKPIPVDKRLAIALWYLNGKTTFLKVQEQFGVGLSTAAAIVVEVCLAIQLELLAETVSLGESVEVIMDGFDGIGFPHCIGVVGGTHINIRRPFGQQEDYITRKGYSSVLLRGTVDHTGRFIDVEIGWSGGSHDAFVFRLSDLFKAMDNGSFVPGNPTIILEGVKVPALILADSTYPIRPWLMKPYGRGGNLRERNFDRALSRARNVVECAFRRLKSRWRCLQDRLEVSLENVDCIITACVILHNICEKKGHAILGDLCPPEPLRPPPGEVRGKQEDEKQKKAGERVRDAMADFLMQHGR